MAESKIDIIDLHARRRGGMTFEEVEGGVVTPTIEAESEFDIAAVAMVDDFLNVFGETIIYYPAGGGSREIKGIVERGEVADLVEISDVTAPVAKIKVANDSTKGVASFEINRGGDQVGYSYMLGNSAQRRPITRVLSIGYAWLILEVR